MGLLLQDMDSMVRTVMVIEREVDDAWNIRDADVVQVTRKESQPSSSSWKKKQRTSIPRGFQGQGRGYQGQVRAPSQLGPMTCFYYHQPKHMKPNCPQR